MNVGGLLYSFLLFKCLVKFNFSTFICEFCDNSVHSYPTTSVARTSESVALRSASDQLSFRDADKCCVNLGNSPGRGVLISLHES